MDCIFCSAEVLFYSICLCFELFIWSHIHFYGCSDNADSNTILENSLSAKEKIISELNMELHNIETTLSYEREQHINEIKKLNSMLNEKVYYLSVPEPVECFWMINYCRSFIVSRIS